MAGPVDDPDDNEAERNKKIIPLGACARLRLGRGGLGGSLTVTLTRSRAHAPPPRLRRPDEDDIALLKTYGLGPYTEAIKKCEADLKEVARKVNDLCGIKESDTGLAPPSQWDLVSDKQVMQEEQPLQVARCTKIISPGTEDAKYVINVKQIAKFVVALADKVSPTDIEEGMRVGVDRT